jgi:hypothetical protein
MLQGEQMVETKLPLALARQDDGSWVVRNGGEYDLVEVCITRNIDPLMQYHFPSNAPAPRRGAEDEKPAEEVPFEKPVEASQPTVKYQDHATEFAWVGDLPAGETKMISFELASATNNPAQQRVMHRSPLTADSLKLDRLYLIAEASHSLAPGETRLVGKIDAILPGARVTPAASQFRGATLVVAHLHYDPLPAPQPDVNTEGDIDQVVNESHLPLGNLFSPGQPVLPQRAAPPTKVPQNLMP